MGKKPNATKKPKTDAEKLQEKKDAFLRVVPQRVNNAVKAIRLVKQCTSGNYVSSPEQKRAVVTAIMDEAVELKEAFEGDTKKVGGFILPEA